MTTWQYGRFHMRLDRDGFATLTFGAGLHPLPTNCEFVNPKRGEVLIILYLFSSKNAEFVNSMVSK